MNKKYEIKPENYGFPSKIGGMIIKTITWKDFPAKPPENTWFLAYTYWNTNWTTTMKNGKGTVLATVSIGPKAWTRAQNDFKLLEHQTGHYWIACLCALEYQKRVNYTQKRPDNMNFSQWCQKIYKKIASQSAQQQKRYDKQTYHYLNQEDQQRWMGQIISKFNQYNKFFEQRKKQEATNETIKKQMQSNQIGRKPPNNVSNRGLGSLPVTKKVVKVNDPKPIQANLVERNIVDEKRKTRQFSVRRINTVVKNKDLNRNLNKFDQAKNTLMGNAKLLEALK